MVKTCYIHTVLTPGKRRYEISYVVLPLTDEVSVEYEIDESALRIWARRWSLNGLPCQRFWAQMALCTLSWPSTTADDAAIERAIERSWGLC